MSQTESGQMQTLDRSFHPHRLDLAALSRSVCPCQTGHVFHGMLPGGQRSKGFE